MNKIKVCLTLLTILLELCYVLGFSSDEIASLPGLKHNITFRQYSGFLDVSENKHFFYWFVESQNNPEKDPVVLWLNGGPGCSSLLGLLTENGPFRVESDGKTVTEHPFSWNRVANVLYLESPSGVGFSHNDNNTYHFSDEGTAEDNHLALEAFFKKFSHLKKNSFYITGESYAGIYIPMLAQEIYKRKSTINLKGLAIGNGALDIKNLMNSGYEYAVSHGLVSTEVYDRLIKTCCNTSHIECDFSDRNNYTNSKDCRKVEGEFVGQFYGSIINPYNIFDVCDPDVYYTQRLTQLYNKILNLNFETSDEYYDQIQSKCKRSGHSAYLNSEAVRKALHIPEQLKRKWLSCTSHFGSMDSYYSGKDSKDMGPIIKDLIKKYKTEKIIVYNGDLDTMCDFIADQRFVDGLGFEISDKFKKWTANGVIAGNVQSYKGGLSFMTVRNAGHMVPTDRPEAALKLIEVLIGVSKI